MDEQISSWSQIYILQAGIDLDIAWLCVSCGKAVAQITPPLPACRTPVGKLKPVARVISDAADPHRLIDLITWPKKKGDGSSAVKMEKCWF